MTLMCFTFGVSHRPQSDGYNSYGRNSQ